MLNANICCDLTEAKYKNYTDTYSTFTNSTLQTLKEYTLNKWQGNL